MRTMFRDDAICAQKRLNNPECFVTFVFRSKNRIAMKEEQEETGHPHACSKSELALRYMPNVLPASARRTMRAWIEKNPELKAALFKAGYTDKAVILTPAQIQIHYDYLGEP